MKNGNELSLLINIRKDAVYQRNFLTNDTLLNQILFALLGVFQIHFFISYSCSRAATQLHLLQQKTHSFKFSLVFKIVIRTLMNWVRLVMAHSGSVETHDFTLIRLVL
jgi:hypothetical protein